MKYHERLLAVAKSILVLGGIVTICCWLFDWLFLPLAILLVFPVFAALSLIICLVAYVNAPNMQAKRQAKILFLIELAASLVVLVGGYLLAQELYNALLSLM
jgi:O-antigen/teichoic acid export membrane protein